MHDAKWKSGLRRRLLKWFDENQRDLPWRKNKTSYRVWVSEIMLQQTQVATVIDYYNRFMKRFPDVKKLAAANESDVLKLWEGLGYYRRARQMHAAAKIVVQQHDAKFPVNFDEVLSLPGIGRYTAGAILSIANDKKLPILEGNTIRLFARLMFLESDPRSSANQRLLWEFSESLLPNKRCGDFNQSLMELGSEVCKPKAPLCDECPIQILCPTYVRGLQKTIPLMTKKVKYEELDEAVVLVKRRGKYLVRLCGAGERWAGLWDFPRFETKELNREIDLEEKVKALTGLATKLRDSDRVIKHAVTRFRITLRCFVTESVAGRLTTKNNQSFQWLSPNELSDLPMNGTGRKIAKRLIR